MCACVCMCNDWEKGEVDGSVESVRVHSCVCVRACVHRRVFMFVCAICICNEFWVWESLFVFMYAWARMHVCACECTHHHYLGNLRVSRLNSIMQVVTWMNIYLCVCVWESVRHTFVGVCIQIHVCISLCGFLSVYALFSFGLCVCVCVFARMCICVRWTPGFHYPGRRGSLSQTTNLLSPLWLHPALPQASQKRTASN